MTAAFVPVPQLTCDDLLHSQAGNCSATPGLVGLRVATVVVGLGRDGLWQHRGRRASLQEVEQEPLPLASGLDQALQEGEALGPAYGSTPRSSCAS